MRWATAWTSCAGSGANAARPPVRDRLFATGTPRTRSTPCRGPISDPPPTICASRRTLCAPRFGSRASGREIPLLVLELLLELSCLLARLLELPRLLRGVGELVHDEVLLPRVGLAHDVHCTVDRGLGQADRHRWGKGDLARQRHDLPFEALPRHDLVHEAEAAGVLRGEGIGGKEQLLSLPRAEVPRLEENLGGGRRHAHHRVRERGVLRGVDDVAHGRQHHAGGDAVAVPLGDGRLAQVADRQALVIVHLLFVARATLGAGADRRDVHDVVYLARRLAPVREVVAGGEARPGAAHDDHPHVRVALGLLAGFVQLADQAHVLRVALLGAVQGNRGDLFALLVEDGLPSHRAPSCLVLPALSWERAGVSSRGLTKKSNSYV